MYATSIRTGSTVLVHLNNDEEIRGSIVSISPTVTNNTVQFRVRLDERDHPLLRPNLKVELYVVKSFRDAVTRVANGPFYRGAASQPVFVVEGSRLHRKDVRLGESNIGYVEILEGLSPGEQVVVSDMSDYERYDEIALK
jgi:HlyD family secretion protein